MANANFALVLGGGLSADSRTAALEGEKPRVYVMGMRADFDAQLFDYQWFVQPAERDR
jgi:hypothetical protein